MNPCFSDIKLFTCNANKDLAASIAAHMGLALGQSEVSRFSDGEINMRINDTVRGMDVFVIQPTSPPVNENLMELLIMIDALRRSSAGRITAVMPYYGYARQDRKARSHDPISAKLVANLITAAGADRVLSMDLHCSQLQGFFDMPVDHLRGVYLFAGYFRKHFNHAATETDSDKHFNHAATETDSDKANSVTAEEILRRDFVVVSPDLGSVARARTFATMLDVPLAIVDKRRPKANVSEVMNIIGEVEGKKAILLDDILDTGGSLTNAANAVRERGADAVYACVTHALFSEDALDKVNASALEELVVLDTIALPPSKRSPKVKVLSVAKGFADAIECIHNGQSLSKLFDPARS